MHHLLEGLTLHAVSIPLRQPFRGVDRRIAVLVHGPSGWGEFSPFPEYSPVMAARWLAAALEGASGEWPVPRRAKVPVNVTVPAVPPETAARLVAESGCLSAKVKVGGESLADEVARVAAVRQTLGPSGSIRIDANGSWSVRTAIEHLRALAELDLEYVEQPVSSLAEMAELRGRVKVPLAADESLRLAADPAAVSLGEAADLVVLKVQPLGGIEACLALADKIGLPVVVSSALETSVGLAAGLALASALPELIYACGLGTALLLAGDVCPEPLVPVGGELEVRRPSPSRELIDRWRADTAAASDILGRLEAAAAHLATRPTVQW